MQPELKKAITLLASLLGIVSAIVGIWVTDNSIRIPAFIILFFIVVGLSVWVILRRWRRKSRPQLPSINMDALVARYSIDQATAGEISWIAQLEASVYSTHDAIPENILKEWYDSNSSGFSIIRMNGQKIGHIDILPLRQKTLQLFIEGAIIEREIRGDSLHPPEEKESIRHLYVESIIIRPTKGRSNASDMAVVHLLCNFISLTRRIANPDKIENIYAIAASEDGKDFMLNLGFEHAMSGEQRKDYHDLFVIRFEDLKARISGLCKRRPGYVRG